MSTIFNIQNASWKCWDEIVKQLEENQIYLDSRGKLCMKIGCGGQFVSIIRKYLCKNY